MSNTEKQIYWHNIIGRFNSSELTQHKFCEQEGIKYRQFKYYLYKFKNTSAKTQELNASAFTQISLRSSNLKNNYQVTLPNGVRCNISSGFNRQELLNLLGVLSQC